jgi:hypothetical protein
MYGLRKIITIFHLLIKVDRAKAILHSPDIILYFMSLRSYYILCHLIKLLFWLYQVYSLGPSEKSKTGKDPYIQKKVILPPETKWVTIGRLPVMVKSKLCWLHELRETECQFDSGGYFIIKGMEKVLPDKIYHVHSVLN